MLSLSLSLSLSHHMHGDCRHHSRCLKTNQGAIVYCKQYGIRVISVESYGDVFKDATAFESVIAEMLERASATKADVLIMATLNVDGKMVIDAMQSKVEHASILLRVIYIYMLYIYILYVWYI